MVPGLITSGPVLDLSLETKGHTVEVDLKFLQTRPPPTGSPTVHSTGVGWGPGGRRVGTREACPGYDVDEAGPHDTGVGGLNGATPLTKPYHSPLYPRFPGAQGH